MQRFKLFTLFFDKLITNKFYTIHGIKCDVINQNIILSFNIDLILII